MTQRWITTAAVAGLLAVAACEAGEGAGDEAGGGGGNEGGQSGVTVEQPAGTASGSIGTMEPTTGVEGTQPVADSAAH